MKNGWYALGQGETDNTHRWPKPRFPTGVCLHRPPDSGAHRDTRRPGACLLVRPTFEQVHGAQLEGDAVLLGEDVDGAAGLGQQVQVELQAHGGGGQAGRTEDGNGGGRVPPVTQPGDVRGSRPQSPATPSPPIGQRRRTLGQSAAAALSRLPSAGLPGGVRRDGLGVPPPAPGHQRPTCVQWSGVGGNEIKGASSALSEFRVTGLAQATSPNSERGLKEEGLQSPREHKLEE